MKRVILTRGLPGSGKSTLGKKLADSYHRDGFTYRIFATDDYFVNAEGEYVFDGTKISIAHKWNQSRVEEAIFDRIDVIVVDNTHTQFWEMIFYINTALDAGYEVEIAEPTTDWRLDIDELFVRNVHKVPREAIERMLKRWQDTDEILLDVAEQRKDVEIIPALNLIRKLSNVGSSEVSPESVTQ